MTTTSEIVWNWLPDVPIPEERVLLAWSDSLGDRHVTWAEYFCHEKFTAGGFIVSGAYAWARIVPPQKQEPT